MHLYIAAVKNNINCLHMDKLTIKFSITVDNSLCAAMWYVVLVLHFVSLNINKSVFGFQILKII